MVFTLSGAFIAAYGFGKLMKIPLKITSLIAMGTAICSGSAIAAIAPIIEAEDQEIAYAISTVFLFNIFAVIISFQKRKATRREGTVNYSFKKIFPWFILWFLVAALLNTTGIIAGQAINFFTELGKFLIILALSAIGLNSDFKKMRETGLKPVALGLLVWLVVVVISLAVQFVTGQI
jgi:uncharacterized membrane protein YadS